MNEQKKQIAYFIGKLEFLRQQKDRGALAMLRRGLKGQVPYEAYRYFPAGLKPWEEEAALLVAPLFALHPQEGGKGNLGDAFKKLQSPNKDENKSLDRRFAALLNCHREDLLIHLRHAVSLLKSKDVPIDWRKLLQDIINWDHADKFVQRDWARSYWGQQKEVLPEPALQAETSDTELISDSE